MSTPSREERIAAILRTTPGASNYAVSRRVNGSSAAMVAAVRAGLKPAGAKKAAAGSAEKSRLESQGQTLDDFRKTHDIHFIIGNAIREFLPQGGTKWFHDRDFRDACGVSSGAWRRYADDSRYAKYRVVARNGNIWAPADMAKVMREMIDA